MRRLQLGLKRAFDVALSVLGLVMLSWLFVVLAGLVHAGSRGPTMIRQERVGRHGRVFTLYKFRTMHPNGNEAFPQAEDLSWLGRHARRWGLDELPQLYNILKGDMSFFGASRPLLPSQHSIRFGPMATEVTGMRPAIISYYGLMMHLKGSGHEVFVSVPALIYDQQAVDGVRSYQVNWHLGKDFGLAWRTVRTAIMMARRSARS